MGLGGWFGRGFGLERYAELPTGTGPQESIRALASQLIRPSPVLDCDEAAHAPEPQRVLNLTAMAVMMTSRVLASALERFRRASDKLTCRRAARVTVRKPASLHDSSERKL